MTYIETHARAEHEFAIQLYSGTIDSSAGVIRGATVAQADVAALGKYVLLDKDGNLTRDPKLAKRKLQVVTDLETLKTLMAAAESAGGRLKVRSDHDDALNKRAGFANNFQFVAASEKDGVKLPARVVADINLNDSYQDREIVLETAKKTPDLIGLSIDFLPSYEVFKDRALMRIDEIYGVDIVDEGAITHSGLFLSRGVDKTPKVKLDLQPTEKMASADDKKEPITIDDCMSAISKLTAGMTELSAAVAKMGAAGPSAEQLAAQKEASEKLAAITESVANLGKQNAALGLKLGVGAAGENAEQEAERVRLAREKDNDPAKKTYLELVEAEATAKAADISAGKLKKSEIHRSVMSAHPAKYREHLKSSRIYDGALDPVNASR